MPILMREVEVKGYAHCRNAHCPGYNQERVDAIELEIGRTVGELSGDNTVPFASAVERSAVEWQFKDEADRECPVCKADREITAQERPQYQPLSGHDPMGLIGGMKFNAAAVNSETDAKHAEEMAEMRKQMADLKSLLMGKGKGEAE